MHSDLKAVIEVQQLDQQAAELLGLIDSLPREIQTLQAKLDNFIHTHEERKKRLAANLKERKDLEGDIKANQEKITKHKDQLYQMKTNEQYKAMLKEIEGEEAGIRKIEDQILEKMIESEEIQKLCRRRRRDWTAKRRAWRRKSNTSGRAAEGRRMSASPAGTAQGSGRHTERSRAGTLRTNPLVSKASGSGGSPQRSVHRLQCSDYGRRCTTTSASAIP